MVARTLLAGLFALALVSPAAAQGNAKGKPDYTRKEDVIYGRKDGVALTMDVFTPKDANGVGVILCVSMRFRSSKEMMAFFHPATTTEFLNRGYTVFAVVHGSQPKFTIPEIVDDIHRAVRFIKANAKDYKIDPDKLGITGGSAGGHLALMMGCGCRPGKPDADDPVDRLSSKVAAVACFFPPSDFLAYENAPPKGFDASDLFPIREFDPKTNKYIVVTPERRREIGIACSPFHCATKAAAPCLIIHGDKDPLVPIKQSRDLIAKLEQCKVACELVEKKDKGHFWFDLGNDLPLLADWFDKQLRK
jgi:acetyl esterase/lipase